MTNAELAEHFDKRFSTIETGLSALGERVTTLDHSINQTIDDNKPSLRMQVALLKLDMALIKSLSGKIFMIMGATPITVLIGYAMLQLFGPGHNTK